MGEELNTASLEETSASGKAAGSVENGHVPPIFVVGVWRSGTTLLYSLLDQHRDIRLFYESDLPVLWPMFRLRSERKNWVNKWEYWNAGVSRHDLDPARLTGEVRSLAEAFEMAGREYAAQKGKTRWGCKSPSYYDRMDFLATEFPDAKFVVIWRDPEEICRSVIKAKATALWFTRPGMTHKALLASQKMKAQVDKVERMGAAVHQLHFRDLVGNTEPTMRAICEFLELPFDPAVANLKPADRSAVFEGAHHTLAKGNTIVATKERNEALPAEMAGKIARYKTMWKAQWGGKCMLSARFSANDAAKPGIGERLVDGIKFMLLRTWDIAPRIAFSILPLPVWRAYRRMKYKDEAWVHEQMTKKPTTLESARKPAPQCAVRLGKVMLHSMDLDELLSNESNELKHVATVNSEIFVYAHENPEFESVLQHTVNTIDGRIVHLISSLIYPGRKLRKMSGSDFIYNIADYAARHGQRVFLLGADPQANRGTVEALRARCPELEIDGYSPAFCANIQDQGWNEDILARIEDYRPAHLVVCFGPMKQEMWISQNANLLRHLGVRCAYGLGGTLDFVSGRKQRAPRWMQNAGVEWLFRVIVEPARLGRTAKMFKMPYFAFRFYNRQSAVAQTPLAKNSSASTLGQAGDAS